jgi:hypothetical protein
MHQPISLVAPYCTCGNHIDASHAQLRTDFIQKVGYNGKTSVFIQLVHGSNLVKHIEHSGRTFSQFFSVLSTKCRVNTFVFTTADNILCNLQQRKINHRLLVIRSSFL